MGARSEVWPGKGSGPKKKGGPQMGMHVHWEKDVSHRASWNRYDPLEVQTAVCLYVKNVERKEKKN